MPGFSYETSPNPTRYDVARRQGIHVRAVLDGLVETFDPEILGVAPADTPDDIREPPGVLTERQDIAYALKGAVAAKAFGPAADGLVIVEGEKIGGVMRRLNDATSTGYEEQLTPDAFNKLFFDSGLWQILLSPADPEANEMRHYCNSLGGLAMQDAWIANRVEELRQFYFSVNTDVLLPFEAALWLITRYTNSALAIGQDELDFQDTDRLEGLIDCVQHDIRQLARVNSQEITLGVELFDLVEMHRLDRSILAVDPNKEYPVWIDRDAFARRVLSLSHAHPSSYVRRGCPILFQKTYYQGKLVLIMDALFDTQLRAYRQSGALTQESLRDTREMEIALGCVERHYFEKRPFNEAEWPQR